MTNLKFSKTMNLALWTAQCVLSLLLLSGAVMKMLPIREIAPIMPWMGEVPAYIVRSLSLIDLAGAIGIILPGTIRRINHLTLYAAAGVFLLMVCAITFHVIRGEAASIWINVFTGILALFIGIGRSYQIRDTGRERLRSC